MVTPPSEPASGQAQPAHSNPMPPFPPKGTAPDNRDLPHPNAEKFINAAAKHTFPDRSNASSTPGDAELEPKEKHEGLRDDDEDAGAREEREEEPIIDGTPLDEMQTPMLEHPPSLTRVDPSTLSADMRSLHVGVQKRMNSASTIRASEPVIEETVDEYEDDGGDDADDEAVDEVAALGRWSKGREKRPSLADTRDFASVRMGASALVSALNALPWDDDDSGSSTSSGDDEPSSSKVQPRGRMSASVVHGTSARPKASRMHSSLHTIRPLAQVAGETDQMLQPPSASNIRPPLDVGGPHGSHVHPDLRFPFRANTIARRARSPGQEELSYQFASFDQARRSPHEATGVPPPQTAVQAERRRKASDSSVTPSDIPVEKLVSDRLAKEEEAGEREEDVEMLQTAVEAGKPVEEQEAVLEAVDSHKDSRHDLNVEAALREPPQDEGVVEPIQPIPQERKRVRREMLAGRLQEVFGLEQREEVIEEMRCWLLRSVMLKGYMYLTRKHICFFAHMPDKENLIVKTGPLYKKASRTKLNSKFWVILKNDVLSWYESTSDPYFPKGNVSLQYASSCDPIDETRFKLRTAERNYTFTADTEEGRDSWIDAIQKVMFKTQHEGESVKLIIPLEVVLEVERSPTLEFAETLEIRCIDPDDQISVDSYFFASFQDTDRTIAVIQRLLDERPSHELPRVNSDLPAQVAQAEAAAEEERQRRSSDSSSIRKSLTMPNVIGTVMRPFTKSSDKVNETSVEPSKTRLIPTMPSLSIPFRSRSKPSVDSFETVKDDVPSPESLSEEEEAVDGYPPRQSGQAPVGFGENEKGWTPSWIKKPATKIFGSSPSSWSLSGRSPPDRGMASSNASLPRTRSRRIKRPSVTEFVEPAIPSERWQGESTSEDDDHPEGRPRSDSQGARLSFSSSTSLGSNRHERRRSDYSMMDQSDSARREDEEVANKFRSVFSLPDKEELLDHFPGYLYRVLPVSGRFFISTNYFCFRSSQLLYKTKMIIPLRDLYGLKAQRAFRFGHSGLIVIIKGHEELFLEFSSPSRRKACITLLEERMEEVRVRGQKGEPDQAKIEARIMEDLDESIPADKSPDNVPPMSPSPLFASTTSTLLEFKPAEPIRITCLTIGSRGDVQPYIALCKGLQAEGHTTRIATHGEYKDWVEGHGIEFASVGGDPAELMQMCVDNGMFTISFMKEGLQKFRGWLDDLLNSSWEACQNTDLLIESPSAMGGIHIAEALRIPYFRAFTMPWTRTRAYPHAFAVPDHKRGGSYNYMTYTMFDQVFWRAISGQVNRWRKNVMGIESTTFDKLEQHKVPFLYNFSPSIVPPPLDWTEWIHVTGYWFLENADQSAKKKWSPPEGLLDFIDNAHKDGKKVVYIGFGSIVVSDPQEMTRCVVDAVKESGVCAILSKGWSDRGSKNSKETGDSDGADGIKYPPEIFSIDSIDHTWLFPRIDAACHHGGAGTSGASFRAGIPTIIKPFFGDQSFWAERAESLNVGSAVRKLTVDHLADALVKATSDEKQIAKAKVVGEMIRRENGVAKAIEAIYRDLEYAKSLIKPAPEKKRDSKGLLHPLTHSSDLNIFRSRSRSIGKGEKDQSKSTPTLTSTSPDSSTASLPAVPRQHSHLQHSYPPDHVEQAEQVESAPDPGQEFEIALGAPLAPPIGFESLGSPKMTASTSHGTFSSADYDMGDARHSSDESWSVVSEGARSRMSSVGGHL